MMFQLVSPAFAAAADTWTNNPNCVSDGVVTIKGLECLYQNIVSPIPALLALVAVAMIIFAGIRLLMAGADPKAYAAAWSTFTWAVIGLILLSAAWLIIILIGKFTGATDLSTFTVGITPTP
jgi:hypothetical protein